MANYKGPPALDQKWAPFTSDNLAIRDPAHRAAQAVGAGNFGQGSCYPTGQGGPPQHTESILQEAHRLTHGPRQADYGHPLDDYTRTAALVSALLAHKLKEPLTASEMALAMVCVKLSREVHAPKRDNCTDGAGYFWVSYECREEAVRRSVK